MLVTRKILVSIPAAILSFIIYLLYTGSIGLFDFITGAVVAIIIGLLTGSIVVKNPGKTLSIRRYILMIIYVIWYFLVAETRAHLDVIKRALHPKMPLNPAIIKVPYNVNTDYAMVLIANSITNTPGTVVVDLDYDNKHFFVHWIDAKTSDPLKARKIISSKFEEFAKKIFD